MIAIEEHRSSTSLWRRLSRREPKASSSEHASTPAARLQKRVRQSFTKQQWDKQPTMAHVQCTKGPTKRSRVVTTSTARAAASDMRTTPFPASPNVHTIGWNVFLAPEYVYSLFIGFVPREMEDKWFIYSEGPDQSGKMKVHFHRSWTGMKIAELFVVVDLEGQGAGTIVGIKWNGTEQTIGMVEEEAKYMVATTCSWVLGVDLEKEL